LGSINKEVTKSWRWFICTHNEKRKATKTRAEKDATLTQEVEASPEVHGEE
jgi:hypothetical protein